jgi:hypothetical protein
MNQEQSDSAANPMMEEPLVVKQISTPRFLFYILHGIGISLGMCLLWGLEFTRNSSFCVLDRLNIKTRTREATAFPPGQPHSDSHPRAAI